VKERALKVAVVVGLVAAAFALRGRGLRRETSPTPQTAETPEDSSWSNAAATVSRFFDAASEADDDAYLRLVSGELRTSLAATRSELGAEAFRAELRRSTSGIVGLATMPGEDAPPGMIAVDVEIVFADRNEYQRMLLAPDGSRWVITSIEEARMVKPPVPYGTPVFEEPAEKPAGGQVPETEQP
jgi:hypothetical protein